MENIINALLVVAVIAIVILIVINRREKRANSYAGMHLINLEGKIRTDATEISSLKETINRKQIEMDELGRKYLYCLLLLNTVEKEWLKGIRRANHIEDGSETHDNPTMTFKYNKVLDTYTVKQLFKKEDITDELELAVSVNGYSKTPLHILVSGLNINTLGFIENGGLIPSRTAIIHRINTLKQ